MLRVLRDTGKRLLNVGPRWLCKYEYKHQSFIRFNERPVEYAFVFKHLGRIYPRSILDVGTGESALPHLLRSCGALVTAVDNVRDYWPQGMFNRHYHIIDDDITNPRLIRDTFDLITCISVLEHIKQSDVAVSNMFKLLNPAGYLILTFPYTESNYIENVYRLPDSRYGQDFAFVCQSYSRNELDRWLSRNNGIVRDQEYWQFWEGQYWTCGNQVIPPKKVDAKDRHQLTCILIQKQ
ncbi:MAG: class I SAM-dependent methyltransferase [Bacteroidota bacterium]